MASIITGLFRSQSQSQKISGDLLHAGFRDEDFIVYHYDNQIPKEIKTNVWQSFFNDQTNLEEDSLVVSVKTDHPITKEIAEQIFAQNESVRQYHFANMRLSDSQSLQYLKRIVSLRAKSEIYETPEIRHREHLKGINSEVFFGKN